MCPRNCNVDREKTSGFCGANNKVKIAKIMLHHWEEPIISGLENDAGSGAIFFSHCNLKCVFCQNYEISHEGNGKYYTDRELADIFKDLEDKGALNINLVTPSHYSQNIINALHIYKPKIPVVWNSGGYDSPQTIAKLKGLVDIFLADFKYYSNDLAKKYSLCPNYFENCTTSLLKMREICPQDIIENGLMKQGILVRHLILPTHTDDSKKVLDWIAQNLGNQTYVSLMSQFTPYGDLSAFPEINRKLKPLEYNVVQKHLFKLGFDNGFVQELSSANTCYIPDFKQEN